ALGADVHGAVGDGRAAEVQAAAGVGSLEQQAAVAAADQLQGVTLGDRDDSGSGGDRREHGPVIQAVLPDVASRRWVDGAEAALAAGAADGRVASGDVEG